MGCLGFLACILLILLIGILITYLEQIVVFATLAIFVSISLTAIIEICKLWKKYKTEDSDMLETFEITIPIEEKEKEEISEEIGETEKDQLPERKQNSAKQKENSQKANAKPKSANMSDYAIERFMVECNAYMEHEDEMRQYSEHIEEKEEQND